MAILTLISQEGELRERLHKKAESFLFVNAKILKKDRPASLSWSAVEKETIAQRSRRPQRLGED